MVWCGTPLVAIARLSLRARRQGSLSEEDCRVLPRASDKAADVANKAQAAWDEHKRLWKVLWLAVRWPLVTSGSALVFRGCCNSLVLPLLLKQIVDAVVDGDRDRALQFVLILIGERILGSLLELWGTRTMSGRVPSTFVCTVGSLVARKAATPGVHGMHDAGVDPVAFLGRELTMLYGRVGAFAHRGFLAVPTLFAGSATLLILLGWPALLGIAWVVSTIRMGFFLQTKGKAAEEKMSIFATERLGVLGNVISAIKAIKYFAWEPEFLEVLHKVRQNECGALRKKAWMVSLSTTLGKLTPVTGALITFVTFAMLGNTIKAGDIFACNSVFMTMRFSVGASAMLFEMTKAVQLIVQRASRVLQLPESPPRTISTEKEGVLASVEDLTVSFKKGSFQLNVVGEMIVGEQGKLTAICGAVGSGKSTLLNALISSNNEAEVVGKSCTVRRIGWVTQKPFIISGTIVDNILLGREYHSSLMETCIADACLGSDLASFQDGMLEMIGDRGTTMSGGQQARLSLARALYDEPDLLLLDDPLAAVDASVGRAILHALRKRCGKSPDSEGTATLSKRAVGVVMVLNQLQLLPMFDKVIFVKDGQCSTKDDSSFARDNAGFLQGIELLSLDIDDEVDVAAAEEENARAKAAMMSYDQGRTTMRYVIEGIAPVQTKTLKSSIAETPTPDKTSSMLIRKEGTATGLVKWSVVREYLFAPGGCFLAMLVTLFIITYALLGMRDWWLGVWADEGGGQDFHLVAGFVAFSLAHIVGAALGVFAIGTFAQRAGERLHADPVNRLLRSTMGFFEQTPAGRITSRFGPDLGAMDSMMFSQLDFTMTFGFTTLVMCGTVIAKVPFMSIVFFLAGVLSVPLIHGFIVFQQDVKRHANNAVAPILSNLGETQRGASLIDVLDCTSFFTRRHYAGTDAWTVLFDSAILLTSVAEAWIQFMHLFVIGVTGALTLADMDSLRKTPGLVGMYFSYSALWGLFASASMSVLMGLLSNMTSLERILEYKFEGILPLEPDWEKTSDPAPASWPSRGALQFEQVNLRYREGLPLALAGLELSVNGGEKLGIVGRTGAGKSSMTTILFRLVECESGRVIIDGVDIAGIGIHTLRRALSMIPQEPIVMNGSIAYNLDPFGRHDKAELERVLADIGLASSMTLDTPAAGGNASLSSGQKQLVTFGRTLLQTSRIVVMDEPTASVDMHTDRLLQVVAGKVFADRTVLTIAHRLETVKQCDRIAVMDAGKLAELGTPSELLSNPSSRLALMHRAATQSSDEKESTVVAI